MAKTNIVVINSDEVNSTMAFDDPKSLINFAGEYLDASDDWSIPCEIILVHKDNQVIRQRLHKVSDLIDFFQGYCSALWLSESNPVKPDMDWTQWADQNTISKAYDSRDA